MKKQMFIACIALLGTPTVVPMHGGKITDDGYKNQRALCAITISNIIAPLIAGIATPQAHQKTGLCASIILGAGLEALKTRCANRMQAEVWDDLLMQLDDEQRVQLCNLVALDPKKPAHEAITGALRAGALHETGALIRVLTGTALKRLQKRLAVLS